MVRKPAGQPEARWVEVSRSQFDFEREGLAIVRSLLPDTSPFRAWSGFEFRDRHGTWSEIDLVVLGRGQLYLVELKYYAGVLKGDDRTWLRDGRDAADSPLLLARRKAQRLKSKLQDELRRLARETGAQGELDRHGPVVPYVQEAVFLHHPGIVCELPAESRIGLFGLDDATGSTGLAGISRLLLKPADPRHPAIGPNREEIIVKLMSRIGARPRQRRAGSWILDQKPLAEGDGWQDWAGSHCAVPAERARIRFLLTPPGAAAGTRETVKRLASHEFRITMRLAHDRVLRPREYVYQDELGPGLVYPLDKGFQRLDLWLADNGDRLSPRDRLALLRQVAEAVAYAHDNWVVHRGLTPHTVFVCARPDGKTQVRVGDWQSAGTVTGQPRTGLPTIGITDLGHPSGPDGPGQPQLALLSPAGADADRQWSEAFQAPEGRWTPGADRTRIDVFALGALAYFLLTGHPPAEDRAALRDRLRRDDGLDLSADLPRVVPAIRAMVLEATRASVTERLPDVPSFLGRLAAAEASTAGSAAEVTDPLDASPRSVIDGRFRLERRLGVGSTAVGLLVTDVRTAETAPAFGEAGEPGEPSAEARVLKVAVDDAAAGRLADEAEVLAGLDHPRLVRLVAGPVEVGGRTALVLENAGDETLAGVLRRRSPVPSGLLRRWGTDLFDALTALEEAGVTHRDIKPANLGVRKDPGDQADHLVLFDFSMTSAGSDKVTAGTPPYLDPFLDAPGRGRYDPAADRYSAAVVLFEMASGTTPRFGDGLSDPASVPDEAVVDAQLFDPVRADALAGFFRTALARDSGKRHGSALAMNSAWQTVFAESGAELPAGLAATGRAPPTALAAPPLPASGPPGGTRAAAALQLLTEAQEIARTIDAGARNSSFVRDGVLAGIAPTLARVDTDGAERLARGLAADRAAALARVAVVAAGTDPAQGARLLADAQREAGHLDPLSLGDFPELLLVRRQILRAVVGRRTLFRVTLAVARHDRPAAIRLLDGARQIALANDGLREELLAGIAAATTAVDATRAEQIARDLTDPGKRAEALASVAAALASTSPDRAERIARELAGPAAEPARAGARARWAAQALVTLARAEPPDRESRRRNLLAQAERLARAARDEQALVATARAVAATDLPRALRLLAEAEQLARQGPDHRALIRVVRAMADLDVDTAERAARDIAGMAVRAMALVEIALAESAVRGSAVGENASAKHPEASRGARLVAEAEQLARTDPDTLVRRPEALVRIAAAAAVADPDRAPLIARGLPEDTAEASAAPRTARALTAVADTWLDLGADIGADRGPSPVGAEVPAGGAVDVDGNGTVVPVADRHRPGGLEHQDGPAG